MSAETIKVCIRFRKELNIPEKEFANWEFDTDINKVKFGEKSWTYDYLLTPECEQDEMYEKVGKQTITDFLAGYNGTIFAYGQSGSGKTFSMLGPEDVTNALAHDFNSVPEEVTKLYGITPRAVIQIFEKINEYVSKGNECSLSCSYIEIYNEQINCLLNRKENLKIRENPVYGMYVADKETRVCKTPEEIFEVISIATKNRAVAGTNQNARSSRSHTILMVELEYNGLDGIKRVSKLNLVDLAGSERIAKTGAEGQRLKEAQKINQSLTTLGMCIMALTTPNSKHVPYRNSKLTLILKESLGGSAKTTLLCTASRLIKHEEESVQTLYFASRAKSIKNVCKVNMTLGTKELQYLADHLKKEVMTLRGQLQKAGIKWNRITDPKLLSFISNELEGELPPEEEDESVKKHVDLRSRRASLVGLGENDIIMKYIDLRAKYDAIVVNASEKIYKLENQATRKPEEGGVSTEEIKKIKEETSQKIEELLQQKKTEIDNLTKDFEKQKADLINQISQINDSLDILECEKNSFESAVVGYKSDIENLKKEIETKEKEKEEAEKKFEESKKTTEELSEKVTSINKDLGEKEGIINQLRDEINDYDGRVNEIQAKYDSSVNQNSLDKVEIEKLNQLINSKNENEKKQAEALESVRQQINTLNEELKKKDNELLEQKKQEKENEVKYKNQVEDLLSKEKITNTQIESLKAENEKISKMLNEKISAQDILVQKEKLENETRINLENKINDIVAENNKLKQELTESKSSFETEKTNLLTQIQTLNREHQTAIDAFEQIKATNESQLKSLQENIQSEIQKNELVNSRTKSLEEKIAELEKQILALKEVEGTLRKEKAAVETESLNKDNLLLEKDKTISNQANEISTLKNEIAELKGQLEKVQQENKASENGLIDEINRLKGQVEEKSKQIKSDEQKEKELKAQITELQKSVNNLQLQNSRLKIENSISTTEKDIMVKKTNTISTRVNLSKNIFGVVLKKTGGTNDYLKQEKENYKKLQERAKEIYKDKLDVLEDLRKNIVTLSPETISSRDDMADLPELDFANEETYYKAEQEMLQKEKIHQLKKEKEKREKQNQIKEMEEAEQ